MVDGGGGVLGCDGGKDEGGEEERGWLWVRVRVDEM